VGLAAKARSNRGLHSGPRCQQRARGCTLGKPGRKAEVRKRHAGFPDGGFDVLHVPILRSSGDGFRAQKGCLWVVGFHLPENQIDPNGVSRQAFFCSTFSVWRISLEMSLSACFS
jgi:hypothetical protein